MVNGDGVNIDFESLTNEGTITVTGNTEGYTIDHGNLIGPETISSVPVFPPTPLTPVVP